MAKLSIYEKSKKIRSEYLKQNQISNYEFVMKMKEETLSLERRLKEIIKSPLYDFEDDIFYSLDELRMHVVKQKNQFLSARTGRHKDASPNPKWRREMNQLRDDVVEDMAYLEALCANITTGADIDSPTVNDRI